MPVQTIGNISLPESASTHRSEHERQQTLKGGIGSNPPGRLIEQWPLPPEKQESSELQSVFSTIEQQFTERPWMVMAVAASLGIALGRLFVRR